MQAESVSLAVHEHVRNKLALTYEDLLLNPNFWPAHVQLTVCYSELGQEEAARAQAAEVLRVSPNFSLEVLRQQSPTADPAETERIVSALRKAGLK